MQTVTQRIEALSPAQRRLLELRLRGRKGLTAAPAIMLMPRKSAPPLSFAQQRLWLIQQLDPESYLYNVPRALRLRGPLDAIALERALNSIIERHEILRTAFPADESGQPIQKVSPELKIKIAVTELTDILEPRREEELQSQILQLADKPFDLLRGPVLRVHLFRQAQDEHVLAIVMHHIISDGWTGGVLFRELGKLYEAHRRADVDPLPELPVQYADYAIWQREWMQGAVLETELAFWREHLAEAPHSVDLPTDHRRPDRLGYEGGCCTINLGKRLSEQLKTLCEQQATTMFPVLLAGLNILLAQWTGQQDQVIGTVTANRDQPEIENLIGCFMNFLPLHTKISPLESAIQCLRRVKQNVFEALAHQNCPFEKIIDMVRPQRSLNINPLYNVALLVQNYPEMAFYADTVEAGLMPLKHEVSFLDLRFVAEEGPEGISIDCEYNKDLFEASTIEYLLKGYVPILNHIAEHPEMRVSEIRIPVELTQQAAVARKRDRTPTVAICSTFTAEPLEESIRFWMDELQIPCNVQFAPFGQVLQQLLDPESELLRNPSGLNVVLVRLEDWWQAKKTATAAQSFEDRSQQLWENADQLLAALNHAVKHSVVPYLLCLCPVWRETVADARVADCFEHAERHIIDTLQYDGAVHTVSSAELLALYPIADYEDRQAYALGHVPYTPEFLTALGTQLVRRFYRIHTPSHKVILLDFDSTLGRWSENGASSGTLDSRARVLQQFLLNQGEAGTLLCLSSTNLEDNVWKVLENPGMLLTRDHLISWRMNSLPNLEKLSEFGSELQIGLDRFIFLSSDPQMVAEMELQCPDVLVLEVPNEKAELLNFLSNVWAFDQLESTMPSNTGPILLHTDSEQPASIQPSKTSTGGPNHACAPVQGASPEVRER